MIDLRHSGDLCSGSGQEHFFGDEHFRAINGAFDNFQSQFFARQLDDSFASDTFENVVCHRRRDQHTIA